MEVSELKVVFARLPQTTNTTPCAHAAVYHPQSFSDAVLTPFPSPLLPILFLHVLLPFDPLLSRRLAAPSSTTAAAAAAAASAAPAQAMPNPAQIALAAARNLGMPTALPGQAAGALSGLGGGGAGFQANPQLLAQVMRSAQQQAGNPGQQCEWGGRCAFWFRRVMWEGGPSTGCLLCVGEGALGMACLKACLNSRVTILFDLVLDMCELVAAGDVCVCVGARMFVSCILWLACVGKTSVRSVAPNMPRLSFLQNWPLFRTVQPIKFGVTFRYFSVYTCCVL